MADDTTATDVKPTAADEEIISAMAEEDKKAETSTEDSSSEEVKPAEGADKDKAEEPAKTDDSEAEPVKEEAKAEDVKTDEDAEDKPAPKDGVARKAQLNTEIRELVATRNKLRQDVITKNAEVYQAKTADELIAEGVEPAEARMEAMEQKQELADFNTRVADLNSNMNIESLQVMADFPMFNPGTKESPNPEYNKDLAEMVAGVYERVADVQRDKNTELIIKANVLPYEIYKSFAEAFESGANTGAVKGQQDADKNLAAADTPSSAKPKEAAKDPFLAGLKS